MLRRLSSSAASSHFLHQHEHEHSYASQPYSRDTYCSHRTTHPHHTHSKQPPPTSIPDADKERVRETRERPRGKRALAHTHIHELSHPLGTPPPPSQPFSGAVCIAIPYRIALQRGGSWLQFISCRPRPVCMHCARGRRKRNDPVANHHPSLFPLPAACQPSFRELFHPFVVYRESVCA